RCATREGPPSLTGARAFSTRVLLVALGLDCFSSSLGLNDLSVGSLLYGSLLDDLSRLLGLLRLRSGLGGRLLGLRSNGLENELDDSHRSVVALTVSDLRDAGVATLAVSDQRCDLGEERVNDFLVSDDRQHATA